MKLCWELVEKLRPVTSDLSNVSEDKLVILG